MNTHKKNIIINPEFYIAEFIKKPDEPNLLFIHGGPGSNSAILEYLIINNHLFNTLNYNIILYDQRGCGKSKKNSDSVNHQDNINDLHKIINILRMKGKKIHGLIGHSYGAKLLFDYYKIFHSTLPGIFISTSNSIITPRINNLILDLAYLKKTNITQYKILYQQIDNLELEKIWDISEKLAPLFNKNPDRPLMYWANLECYAIVQHAQNTLDLPLNTPIFQSVRKDLYLDKNNFSIDIHSLSIPYLWINGFHDYIMGRPQNEFSNNKNYLTFYKSAHYPHLEENILFCEHLNAFFKN